MFMVAWNGHWVKIRQLELIATASNRDHQFPQVFSCTRHYKSGLNFRTGVCYISLSFHSIQPVFCDLNFLQLILEMFTLDDRSVRSMQQSSKFLENALARHNNSQNGTWRKPLGEAVESVILTRAIPQCKYLPLSPTHLPPYYHK